VRSRWFSPTSLLLHVTLLIWVAGCLAAMYWQVGRAFQGNQLSFMYAVEWPLFAVVGVMGWWALLHMEPVTEEEKAQRRAHEERMRAQAQAAKRRPDDEDPALAAYNDHLARLAEENAPKRWKR
jgi:DNA-binding transcriptional regulator of glucitol operon